jgi:hypothetical protein
MASNCTCQKDWNSRTFQGSHSSWGLLMLTHINNRYRMRTPIFSVNILSPQNDGFQKAFWLAPDSCDREFRAVAGSAKHWNVTWFLPFFVNAQLMRHF